MICTCPWAAPVICGPVAYRAGRHRGPVCVRGGIVRVIRRETIGNTQMTGVPAPTLYHRWPGWHAPDLRRALTAFTAGLIVAAVLLPFVTWGADAGRGLGRRRAHCPCGHLIDHHPGRQLTGPAVGCPRRRDRRLSQSAAGRGQCRQPPGGRLRASPCGAAQRRTAGAADRRRGADRRAVVDCDRRPRPPQTPAIAAASAPIRLPSTRPSPAGCSSTAHSSTSGALPGRTAGFANRCPPERGHRLPPSRS